MHLIRRAPLLAAGLLGCLAAAVPCAAQAPGPGSEIPAGSSSGSSSELSTGGGWEVDFLLNYYDQDGEHSPVTGGIGTEDMQVVSPIVVVRWDRGEAWNFSANLGVDTITSASTDNIDLGEVRVSSASRVDSRAFTTVTASRTFGKQDVGLTLGFSNEYDYQSRQIGIDWSRSFRKQNTLLGAAARHYDDTVELYGTDGIVRGEDGRTTTDLTLSLSQVLGPKTLLAVELYASEQSGLLSTPFHEVILAPGPGQLAGDRVAERLPDQRSRTAIGVRLNHAVTKRFVPRLSARFYDDDWGLTATTMELETHFRLPGDTEMWLFPIFRYHTQESSDYFGLPATFDGSEDFFTADRELGELTSEKVGLGWSIDFGPGRTGWKRRFRWFETRLTSYSRDDDLDALSLSLGMGLSF